MRNYLVRSILALACLALVVVPVPVRAQSSDIGMSIRVSPTSTTPGGTVGVFAVVTNNTSSKLRTTVTFTSLSPCGTETTIGYTRLALSAGQSMQVTVSYPLPPDACLGMYTVSITAKSGGGGKNSTSTAAASASAYLTVD
jgi:hypothetical protein